LLVTALAFLALYRIGLDNYLLFHGLVELFSIVVAFGVFVIFWNTRQASSNGWLCIIGVSSLFVGALDAVHTLAYRGMAVFADGGSNLPTQLWLAARYLQAASFLIAPLLVRRTVSASLTFAAYFAVTGLLLLSIFAFGTFPVAYVEGQGLTTFKKVSEYLIAALFGFSAYAFYAKRHLLDRDVVRLLVMALVVLIFTELAFTAYLGVYDVVNMLGHFCKLVAFYLLYKAVVETAFVKPHNLLLRDLTRAAAEREQLIGQLRQALSEVKALSGLLPICAACKRVRDDQGYWQQVEDYIRSRSEAEFTHSICPECLSKLYADLGVEEQESESPRPGSGG
jgi:hypothetical protein